MAYETLLDTQPLVYDYRGDALDQEFDGPLARPYVGMQMLHEAELGIYRQQDTYDPLTAPLEEVIEREYASAQAYRESPIAWDRQAETAHYKAFAQTTALGAMRRVSEYRAQRPTDMPTMQLRLAPPEVSSVDTVLAELKTLRTEIAYEKDHPPMFAHAQTLRTRQYESALLPTDSDSKSTGPAALDTFPVCSPSAVATGTLPAASPATMLVREPAHFDEGYASGIIAETKLAGSSSEAEPIASESRGRRFQRIKLSAQGARQFISRITRQAVLWS